MRDESSWGVFFVWTKSLAGQRDETAFKFREIMFGIETVFVSSFFVDKKDGQRCTHER